MYNSEEAIVRVGSLGTLLFNLIVIGRFQMIALFMTYIAFVMEGYVVYPLSLLALMPAYICFDESGEHSCSNLETCDAQYNHEI
jgi:hypothetical protein